MFVEIIHTMVPNTTDDYRIWNEIINNKGVVKRLVGQPIPSKFVQQIIKASNAASSQGQREEAISLIAPHMAFVDLKQFNFKNPKTDDFKTTKQENMSKKKWRTPEFALKFRPPIGRKTFDSARKHYYKNKECGLGRITKSYRREAIPMTILRKFVRFVCSKAAITQSAYGTSKMFINGVKCIVPQVYRMMDMKTTVKRGIEFLKQEGIPEEQIPHERTLEKVLQVLPAKQVSQLKGINPYLVSQFKISNNL